MKKKKNTWGGKRPGSGRKKNVHIKPESERKTHNACGQKWTFDEKQQILSFRQSHVLSEKQLIREAFTAYGVFGES